ncbi:MAG: tol-pal system protein YbgF, partial [Thermodesulfovibrio sp.]|nr:tol-pal system protein YbgF [Thermodesulfovibrio sp.]
MKKGKIKLTFIGLISSLFLSGCVTMGEYEQMRADIAKLYVENNQLRQEVSELKTRVDKMSSDLNAATALKEGQLTLISQTQDYVKELQLLKGRFEENSYNNEKKFKELNEKIAELQTKITQPSQPVTPKETEQKKTVSEPLKNPKEIYDSAHIDIKEKKYASARSKFEEIIKSYPDFELLPNSYFWVAETYYNEKKYEEAILSYEEFLKKYPKHEKAPGALLKEGMAFLELKDRKTAKVVFERVIERYPKSKEAEIAQQKIGEILKSQNAGTKSKSKTKT